MNLRSKATDGEVQPGQDRLVLCAPLLALDHVTGLPRRGPFSSWILPLTDLVGGQPAVEVTTHTALRLEELAFSAVQLQEPEAFASVLSKILSLAIQESERQLSRLRSASLAELGIALLLSAPELEREVMCRALDVSSSYLARQFQHQVGTSFAKFRTRARVVSFLAAAAQPEGTLLQAALSSGFGSYSQAHRVFSALTGHGPRDYLHDGGRSRISELMLPTLA